jgi:hypothetical protein
MADEAPPWFCPEEERRIGTRDLRTFHLPWQKAFPRNGHTLDFLNKKNKTK